MKRKLVLTFLSLIVISLVWFLFFKKYDYQINFSAKTSPGTIYSRIHQVKSWNTTKYKRPISTTKAKAFSEVYQTVKLEKKEYQLYWKITPLNDSITNVNVYVKDLKQSLKQRLLFLIGKSEFIHNSVLFIKDFNDALQRHLNRVQVTIKGKAEKPAFGPVIYVNFKTKLPGKARKMAKSIYFLENYLEVNHLKKTGNPFLEITKWNQQQNTIDANFCFPVEKLNFYPKDSMVKIKKYSKQVPALKAIFHGNYQYSDRAWFALANYVKNHNLTVSNSIIEIYNNDPHTDPNELTWKATVYMPIK